MFKRLSFLLVFLSTSGASLFAQTTDSKTWISLTAVHQEYYGDLGNELLTFNIPNDMGVQLGLHRYLNPSFDLSLSFLYGSLDTDSAPFFRKSYVSNQLRLRYNLANGYIFKEDATIQPFLTAGGAFTPFFGGSAFVDDQMVFGAPMGGGFDIRLGDRAALTIQSLYLMNFNDDIDGTIGGSLDQDNILATSVGLKFGFGGGSDRDGDGIADKKDACADEPGSRTANGCPDRDRDRVADSDDLCPDVPGDEAFRGCTDTDGDTVPDYQDECPETPGSSEMKGCLDSDNDRIPDPFDGCPEIAGDVAGRGCPDTDGDGVKNAVDRCPNVAGLEEFEGCPDSDGDGIVDSADECPLQPGYPYSKGCPDINPDVRRALDYIMMNLIFPPNSDNIDPTSRDDLDVLVNIMKDDPKLFLSIEGHTDNRGAADYNLRISDLRAKAVMKYLVDRGISPERITAIGYGQTRPIATNETAPGRLKNRRVELKLSYN